MNVNNLGIGFSEVINGQKKSRHYFEVIYLQICCECSRDYQNLHWILLGKGSLTPGYWFNLSVKDLITRLGFPKTEFSLPVLKGWLGRWHDKILIRRFYSVPLWCITGQWTKSVRLKSSSNYDDTWNASRFPLNQDELHFQDWAEIIHKECWLLGKYVLQKQKNPLWIPLQQIFLQAGCLFLF